MPNAYNSFEPEIPYFCISVSMGLSEIVSQKMRVHRDSFAAQFVAALKVRRLS